ncbi:5'/3'-nucleotidase SurE [Cupriavidus neocaledonicus]|uniref:5'-nucleotidase n=1 Tax=Cupriavidus neocaledonicus TaxID=1040979 RepID=A0A375HVF9_9BURK|nr:5'/3'-nucleotidase SurE [Cupriavidus neocaledonicus]SOZ39947.1 putative acid phosphatase, putative 5'-nucleotidase (surE-like) [Cupriavidus neocaledonicus]SPD60717.1 putative acid phosphatase, 5'-nucleotidase (SurE-like) [Cupriavidus neocaledonicus]
MLRLRARPRLAGLAFAAMALAVASSPAHALNILLTNDDGCAAPGIAAVRKALQDAGHRVVTVGPATNQSGSGAAYAVPDGRTRLVVDPLAGSADTFCVHRVKPTYVAGSALNSTNPDYIGTGSPVDATAIGLKIVAPETGLTPDLVVSGANFGENLSDSIPHSGTVMNVLYAARRGVPGIALSVGVDFAEARSGFPGTLAAFPKAGAFLARVIATLEATRAAGQPLLPMANPLSINYPVGGAPAGVRLTVPGTVDSFTTAYKRNPDNTVSIDVGAAETELAALAKTAETPAFLAKYITISPLDVDFRPTPLARGLFNRSRRELANLAP